MKHLRKVMALVIATFMALVVATPAFAAALPTGTAGADKTITITSPTGLDSSAVNTYTVYKVFDATTDGTGISYTSIDGNVPAGFVKDDYGRVYLGTATDTATSAAGEIAIQVGNATKYIVPKSGGNLTDTEIAAIAAYTGKVEVGTVEITGTDTVTVTVPDFGYYYITTTTGSVVTVDSTHKSATVIDKNTVPGVDKKITGATSIDAAGKKALEQLGKDVEYTAVITVAKGCKDYVFHDKMGTGLTFKGNSDVTVTIDDATKLPTGATEANFYTIKGTPDSPDTLTITFVDGIAEGAKITVKYKGTVNSDALTVDTGKNTAYVSYGDSNSNNKTPVTETNVYNAKLDVLKVKGDGTTPLAGAGFVITNSDGKYYKYTAASGTTPATVSWYELGANETLEAAIAAGKVTENVSAADGKVPAFTGLATGSYTLIESTVPAGFNKAADKAFTIKAADADLTANSADVSETVINNQGAELPETGGMGTRILYTIGGIMVVGGAIVLISKRRLASMEK